MARVIYFNLLTDGVIALLIVYTKAKFDNLPTAFLLQLWQTLRCSSFKTICCNRCAFKTGKFARVTKVESTMAARVRQSVGVTLAKFASLLGVSVRTLQEWEQGRREPTGAAKTLLTIALRTPEVLRAVV